MREQLAEVLAADEYAAKILRGAHPRGHVDHSGEVEFQVVTDSVPPREKVG
jgi:hypothetical protein